MITNTLLNKINKQRQYCHNFFKISDFTDVMKEQIIKTKTIETGPLEGNLVRLETDAANIDAQTHWNIWSVNIGSQFVFGSAKHGLIENTNSRFGPAATGSSLYISGGDY